MGTEPNVLFEGYLLRKQAVGWKRRYFVLYSNKLLAFYEHQDRAKFVGEMLLVDGFQVIETPCTSYSFRLVAGGTNELILAAESAAVYGSWISELKALARRPSRERSGSSATVTPPSDRKPGARRQLQRTMSVTTILGKRFVMDPRYVDLKPIGQGAYGLVVSCTDTITSKRVAIKKISALFDDSEDAKRIIREIRFMRKFAHPKLLCLVDIFEPFTPDYNELYMASELVDTDLHKVIKSGQALSEEHQRYIMYQILIGLNHMHKCRVVHRDLKPSNILLTLRCEVKICDFGLSRVNDDSAWGEDESGRMTEYVVTRWYRAPEVMLSSGRYAVAIDIWSAGCVFAEMQLGEPLFRGKDYTQQLKLIAKFLGNPTEEDLAFVKKQRARDWMMRLPQYSPIHLHHMFPRLSSQGRQLLARMLKFNPAHRITAGDAVADQYFDAIRDPQLETVEAHPINADDIEAVQLNTNALRALMTSEIQALKEQMNPSCALSPTSDHMTQSTEGMTPSSDHSTRSECSRGRSNTTGGVDSRRRSFRDLFTRKWSMSSTEMSRARTGSEREREGQPRTDTECSDSDSEAEVVDDVQNLNTTNSKPPARSRPLSERLFRGLTSSNQAAQHAPAASVTPSSATMNFCAQVSRFVRTGSFRKPVATQSG